MQHLLVAAGALIARELSIVSATFGVGRTAARVIATAAPGIARSAVYLIAAAAFAALVGAPLALAHDNVRIASSVTLNNGSGDLLSAVAVSGGTVAGLGDFDGDSKPDILTGRTMLLLAGNGSVKPGGARLVADVSGYGFASEAIGDLDGDGVTDVALSKEDYSFDVVRIAFLNADGTVKGYRDINGTPGDLTVEPLYDDAFGESLALLGDLDNDGAPELAVGAIGRDAAGQSAGAIWIVFLNPDATVKSSQLIDGVVGGLTGLAPYDYFGNSVAGIGDFDGDGIPDVAVGAPGDDDGGTERGAVWLLFLNADGTVKAHHKISAASQDVSGYLDDGDYFGHAVESLGDVDGDSVTDIAVGAPLDDDGAYNAGAVWIVLLDTDGSVKDASKISALAGGLGSLAQSQLFGLSIADIGDLDGNGASDLAVGSGSNFASPAQPLWILFRNLDGTTVASHAELGPTSGGFDTSLIQNDHLGSSLARLGDLDGDGVDEIVAGAPGESDSTTVHGSTWILYLNAAGTVRDRRQINGNFGHGVVGDLDLGDQFGASVAALGDFDSDGVSDFVAGAPGDDDGGSDRGAVWVLRLTAEGGVKAEQKISSLEGGFAGTLADGVAFGSGVAGLGDLDGDGIGDIAVADDGIWILFLNPNATVKSHHRLDVVADSVGAIGDLDGDGKVDLAAGDPHALSGGAITVYFLNSDGSIRASQLIDELNGGFTAVIPADSEFGESIAGVGDLDGDGVPDVAVGTPDRDQNAQDDGGVWLLYMRSDGTVKSSREIAFRIGGLVTGGNNNIYLGSAVARTSDLDGDGLEDLVIGASGDSQYSYYGNASGALYVARLGRICDEQPRQFCLAGARTKLSVKRTPGRNTKTSLQWKLSQGATTPIEAFGNPTLNYNPYPILTGTEYALCIYDSSAGTPQISTALLVQPFQTYYSGSSWAQTSTGWRYDDKFAGRRDGIRRMSLFGGDDVAAQLSLKASGASLPMPPLAAPTRQFDVDPSIIVQMTNSDGACWTTEIDAGEVLKNTATQFVGNAK